MLSDLHLECHPWTYDDRGEDVTVLAGDICARDPGSRARATRLMASIPHPTVYVPGNHEYYQGFDTREAIQSEIRADMREPGRKHVRLLDDAWTDIEGVRFIGSTLWSDFWSSEMPRDVFLDRLPHAVADFGNIRGPSGRLTGETMAAWADGSKRFLDHAIRGDLGPMVVVTHFLPAPQSVSPRYAGSALNAYFMHDVSELIAPPVRLWVHGHTHVPCHYWLNGVEVVCNPRGYHGEASGYDSDLIITI